MDRSGPVIPDKFSTFYNATEVETDSIDNSTKPPTNYEGQGFTDTVHVSRLNSSPYQAQRSVKS